MILGMTGWAVALVLFGCILFAAAAWALWIRALERAGDDLPKVAGSTDHEQREDLEGRDRIAALEARWLAVARHLTVMVVVLTVTTVLALVGIYALFGRLQDSRVASLKDTCEQTNREHATIRQFVGDRDPALTARVVSAFPIESDCAALARQRAKVK